MKRFWDQAEAVAEPEGWSVRLDARPLRLPGGGALVVPQVGLAQAIVAEWQAAGGGKGGEMSYADVPLTRLAGTARERVAGNIEPVVLELARYAESDLLCYRAEEPEPLSSRQQALWQPWLDWAERRHGARLRVTAGIVHVAQDPAALAALAGALSAFGAYPLAALGVAVPALGSLVLGLALAEGVLGAAEAHAAATLDETFQEELWGRDDEAVTRRERVGADVALAARFLDLVRAS